MKTLIISLGMVCALALVAHGQDVTNATCKLESKSGSQVTGTVTFMKMGDEVHVVADITGLKPGKHGFHIHEKGDCSSGDGMSTGGHFNPLGKPHGNPAVPDHHGGDMPMLVADAAGNATLDVTLDTVTLRDGASSVVGRAVVVHKDPDDYVTQPTGNSGARVACGVIAAA